MPSKLGRFFLPVVSGKILQANKKNKQNKWYTRSTALSGMKILADFDKLISEQRGNTGLRCLIIINVAYLQRTSLPQYEIKLYPAPFFVSDATTYSIPW